RVDDRGERARVDVGDDDLRALAGEALRHGATDPAGPAGHDGNTAAELGHRASTGTDRSLSYRALTTVAHRASVRAPPPAGRLRPACAAPLRRPAPRPS